MESVSRTQIWLKQTHTENTATSLRDEYWMPPSEKQVEPQAADYIAFGAAMFANLTVLKWVHEEHFNWTCGYPQICAYAAGNGDMEMLQWAKQKGFPWQS